MILFLFISDTAMAVIVAIPPTLAALAAAIVAVIAAARSKVNGEKVDRVATQAAEIVHATNGTLSRLNSANDVLASRIEGLERALAASQLSGQEANTAARQAASDVQTALEAPCPPVPGE